ncbi:hypothetical protein EC988_004367, partial [Linderina pennispora]
ASNLAMAIVIILVIILQASFSAWQEWVTRRAMDSIAEMLPAETLALRDGEWRRLSPADLVQGDIVYLQMGDKAPADIRIVDVSMDAMFDRSALSGAPDPTIGTVNYTNTNYLETRNMVMQGANVTQGNCTGVVVATGDRTVIGRIAKMMTLKKPDRSILEIEVHRLVNGLTTLSLVVGIVFIILWAVWLRTTFPGFMSVADALANGVGVLVTFVPGSLPISLTLTLTAIARRMQRHNVLIKNLTTVETLGSVSVICCEKTGTLTQRRVNVVHAAVADQEMTVGELVDLPSALVARLYESAALCNAAEFEESSDTQPLLERPAIGDATDAALLRFSAHIHPEPPTHQILFRIPFNIRNRWQLSVCKPLDGSPFVLVNGAPEELLMHCTSIQDSRGEIVELTDKLQRQMQERQRAWAEQGERVLMLCRRDYGAENPFASIEDNPSRMYQAAQMCMKQGLCCVGLVGMVDPPRREIPGVVDTFRAAGVRVYMVTGDYAATAAVVARQCRIITGMVTDTIDDVMRQVDQPSSASHCSCKRSMCSEKRCSHSLVVSGPELKMLRSEHWDVMETYEEIVFARITPEQKLQVVEELARRDHYVAVTGDDVNDLPAMRAAQVAVAMGNGSEVAKEAADMVLLDNNFSSIVVAIECGRLVFVNLKKVIIYLLPMTNLSEIVPSLLNVVLGLPIPLSTFLMLVINTVTDVWASINLINEEPESDLLLHPPRNPKREGLVNVRFFLQAYGFIGLWQTFSGHFMFFLCIYLRAGIAPKDVFLAFNKWTDGYMGKSQAELSEIVRVAGSAHFFTLVVMQWGNMFVARTRTLGFFQQNPFCGTKRNPQLLVAIPISIAVALLVNEVGWFNRIFLTGRIPVEFFFLPIPFALFLIVLDEARKMIVRRYPTSLVARLAW